MNAPSRPARLPLGVLRQRLLFGPILILLVLLGAWLDAVLDRVAIGGWLADLLDRDTLPPGIIVFLFMGALSAAGGIELAGILRAKSVTASTWLTATLAVCGLSVTTFAPRTQDGVFGVAVVATMLGLALVFSLIYYSRRRRVQGMIAAAGGALLAFCYLGLLAGFIVAIRREHAVWILVWVLLVAKSSDIGAFVTGKSIGKHKLIVWLSPGKTWEGFFGGIVFASVIGAATAPLVGWLVGDAPSPSWLLGAILGAVFGVMGQAGDLLASLLKRDAGIKDSGSSIPGFGGVLDVVDSLMLVAPVAYWVLKLSLLGVQPAPLPPEAGPEGPPESGVVAPADALVP